MAVPELAKVRVHRLVVELPGEAWTRLSCGDGARGPRMSDWAVVDIRTLRRQQWGHWLLARRSISNPGDIAYYICFGPAGTTLEELVRVAGARWAIEECFQMTKNETGLDHYQVRGYQAWYRHITLSMAAAAAVTTSFRNLGLPKPVTQTSQPPMQPQPLAVAYVCG